MLNTYFVAARSSAACTASEQMQLAGELSLVRQHHSIIDALLTRLTPADATSRWPSGRGAW